MSLLKKSLFLFCCLLTTQSLFSFWFSGCPRSGFVGGVNLSYAQLNVPQAGLYALKTFYARNTGLLPTDPKVRQSNDFHHFTWRVYGGYECLVQNCLLFGVEAGYRDIGLFKIVEKNLQVPVPAEDDDDDDVKEDETKFLKPFRQFKTYSVNCLFTCRYVCCSGLNVFAKAGPAYLGMHMREGKFVSPRNPSLSGREYFKKSSLHYQNIYPEFNLGVGWYVTDYINICISYDHVCGSHPINAVNGDTIFLPPASIPSLDSIGINIEFKL